MVTEEFDSSKPITTNTTQDGYTKSSKSEFLTYFFAKGKEIRKKKLRISPFKFQFEHPEYLIDSSFEVIADFQSGNKNNLVFNLISKHLKVNEDFANQKLEQLLLVSSIFVIALLIFVSLIALIVLFENRKRDVINQLNSVDHNDSIQSIN